MRPNEFGNHPPRPTSAEHLQRYLEPTAAQTFRLLCDVLLCPPDIPRITIVLTVICSSVNAYGATLNCPNGLFRHIHRLTDDLKNAVIKHPGWSTTSQELAQPLLRRLLPHAPYAVFLSAGMLPDDQAARYWVALGAEVASCLATGKSFSRAFANELRREITPQLFGSSSYPQIPAAWEKSAAKKQRRAAKLFEATDEPDPSDTSTSRLFDFKAGNELTRKLRYSAPRQRQALLDRHHQSEWQFKASASQLLCHAEAGDQTALLTLIAFSTGLSLATTLEMPICTALTNDESVMAPNLDDGVILTNIGRLTPSSAKPPPDTHIFREASWIAVKPMPILVVTLLRRLATQRQEASTLADLLTDASTSGRQLTLIDDHSALKATAARFLASAGPVTVGLGIDRLSAALLTNDFSVIPGSKLYYALAQRESIWNAASRLFSALGWGPAAPFLPGLPVGSHIVPQREAITDWLSWMSKEIKRMGAGRHCGFDRLVMHHNVYARLCASITVWLLAAREAKEFSFTTCSLNTSSNFASLNDKWAGTFPGELWVPICTQLRAQLNLWLTHCAALRFRIAKHGLPPEHALMAMLDRFTDGDEAPLFFEVDTETYCPRRLGSADLTRWWPRSHRFSSDFGRHFWETELREANVSSSRIDILMRHITQAVESHCSTHSDPLSQVANDVNMAQSELLRQLGFTPIPGLVSRHKELP